MQRKEILCTSQKVKYMIPVTQVSMYKKLKSPGPIPINCHTCRIKTVVSVMIED